MPIIFISLSEYFTEKIKQRGYEAKTMKIQEYTPDANKRTYYVSPANSLCFMDGGIDYALSRIVFPDIEQEVKTIVKKLGIKSLVGRPYLPIGSSIIIDRDASSLVIAPTMLLPQNVSSTLNAYYATMAVLYNVLVNRGEKLDEVDILFTSFCCGYGKMDEDFSIIQILKGIEDYHDYMPLIVNENIIISEPALYSQPKYYQNTEFFDINPADIVNIT